MYTENDTKLGFLREWLLICPIVFNSFVIFIDENWNKNGCQNAMKWNKTAMRPNMFISLWKSKIENIKLEIENKKSKIGILDPILQIIFMVATHYIFSKFLKNLRCLIFVNNFEIFQDFRVDVFEIFEIFKIVFHL